MCDKQHSHASWKPWLQDGVLVFPTAEEAAYPFILCERIVAATISAIEQLGCKTYSSLGQHLEITGTNKMNRIIFGALPRAAYLKPLVADYIDFHYIIADPQRPDTPGALFLSLPKGTKLLSRRMFKWGECRVVCNSRERLQRVPFKNLLWYSSANHHHLIIIIVISSSSSSHHHHHHLIIISSSSSSHHHLTIIIIIFPLSLSCFAFLL